VSQKVDEANLPAGTDCLLDAEVSREGLIVAEKPVRRIQFHGNILGREIAVRIPSVVAYDAPGVLGIERQAFVEKVDLGEFEITSSSNDVLVMIDLSPIQVPIGAKFHSVNLQFDRVVRMRALEVIGFPPFRIHLRDVRLRVAPFEA
jgi:hypothetical protein